MYSNMNTAMAVTRSSMTNIITHTDALKGSEGDEEESEQRLLSVKSFYHPVSLQQYARTSQDNLKKITEKENI